MVADSKKVQTMVNIIGQQSRIIRAAVAKMKSVRTRFNSVNPDVTGTPLQGRKAAVSTAIDALDTAASSAAVTQMINSIVPSHRNKAI